MADNKRFCEEIEIAIYSDAELTQEQKQHIENCETCRALLSQVSSMKKELRNLSVPCIKHGEIADKVMQTIALSKKAIPSPKFKITHHLGTAAAIVIIFAAALILKNPSDDIFPANDKSETNNTGIVFETEKNNHVLSVTSETNDIYNDAQEEPVVKMRVAAPIINDAANENTNEIMYSANDTVSEHASEETLLYDDADSDNGASPPVMMFKAAPSHSLSDSIESDEATLSADELSDSAEQGIASGSGGGSSSAEAVSTTEKYDSSSEYIFDGLEFLDGEENFEYNIAIANERLSRLYKGKYVVSKQKLISLGVNNKKLLKIAPTITYDMFNFYKNILDVFE